MSKKTKSEKIKNIKKHDSSLVLALEMAMALYPVLVLFLDILLVPALILALVLGKYQKHMKRLKRLKR